NDQPASRANLTVNGVQTPSADDGSFTWSGTAAAQVTTALSGPIVTVQNAAGSLATTTLSVAPGGTAIWDASASEFDDAQLTAFIATWTVKHWAKTVDPSFTWPDGN